MSCESPIHPFLTIEPLKVADQTTLLPATVVALPRPHSALVDIDLNLDFPELAVLFRVTGNVANGIKAAHFFCDLGKGLPQIAQIASCVRNGLLP